MTATASSGLERDLKGLLGSEAILPGTTRAYLTDATESRNLRGRADAVALPSDAQQVATLMGWCYEHDVPIIPRGGGTGFTGGAVPLDGGLVLSLERVRKIRSVDPGFWRAEVEAGVITAEVRRRARENGLFFPPDPGSAEQSQIGGNIAAKVAHEVVPPAAGHVVRRWSVAVRNIGNQQQVEILVGFDQRVDEHKGVVGRHIIVHGAVRQQ